jgi:hypothetical protein
MTKTTSKSERTRTLRLQLVDDDPHGLRHVDSLASMLTVTAGPLPVMNAFTKNIDNKIGYMDYVCEGALSYIGHGYAERRLGEKFSTQDRDRIEQAYVVHSLDPRFGKDLAEKLEDRLIEIARDNLVPLANGPMVGGLGGKDPRSPEIEELLRDVRKKLWFAGCRLFEHRHPAAQPTGIVCNGIEIIEPEELARMDMSRPVQLNSRGLQARACWVGERLVVLPGADFSKIVRKGVTKYNIGRRAALENAGLLEDIPGVSNRARLRKALAFDSAAVAAKILVGKHVGNNVWESAAAPPPRLVAGAGHD